MGLSIVVGLTNVGSIVSRAKNELRSSVIPRAYITDVRFSGHQYLRGTKITQLEHAGGGIQEQVLGLNVPMTYSKRVDISQ